MGYFLDEESPATTKKTPRERARALFASIL